MSLRVSYAKWAYAGCLAAAAGVFALPPIHHQAMGNLSPQQASKDIHTDGVVIFTGSRGRIPYGYQIFSRGLSNRMMISGVDPVATNGNGTRAIVDRVKEDSRVYLDYRSANTIQNAHNTAAWVKREGITSLRLVTSDFHMPRAYFELRRLLPPSVTLYAAPVPGEPRASGVNSEESRLTCRIYETSLGMNFCYGTRRIMQTLGLR